MSRFAAKPATVRPPAQFSTSYSKIKTFENCPKKYGHLYVVKDVKEEDSEHLRIGNEIHAALAKAIEKGEALPADLAEHQHWVDKFRSGAGTPGVSLLVEQKLAINDKFQPVEFFAKDAWFRAIVDVAKLIDDVGVVADWKTGKIVEDSVQLALFAAVIFAHHPQIMKLRTEFIWLNHDATTREDFSREEMPELWSIMMPRIEAIENAHRSMDFPAVQSGLCRWCPVKSCINHKG